MSNFIYSFIYIIVDQKDNIILATTDYNEAKEKFNTFILPGYYLYRIPGNAATILKIK